jgi:hypothetical protein
MTSADKLLNADRSAAKQHPACTKPAGKSSALRQLSAGQQPIPHGRDMNRIRSHSPERFQ